MLPLLPLAIWLQPAHIKYLEDPLITIYLTVLKGMRGIVFTHGVRMGGRQAGGGK